MRRFSKGRGRLLLLAVMLVVPLVSAQGRDGTKEPVVRYQGIPPGAYSIVAEVRAKPGREAELRAATLPLIAQVRAEPNNLVYVLQENREVPGHFVFYEIFATRADFEAHNATPHVQRWFARLPELADGGVKVMRLEVLGAPER